MTIVMTLLAVAVLAVVDQAVKYWAVTALAPVGSLPLIPGVLQLTYVENRGAAFSILQDQIWLFLVLTALVLAGVVWAFHKNRIQTALGKLSLILIAAGAAGNGIDRLFRRYVVDMIETQFITFPVFNIADIYVTAGVALFAFYVLFQHKDGGGGDQQP